MQINRKDLFVYGCPQVCNIMFQTVQSVKITGLKVLLGSIYQNSVHIGTQLPYPQEYPYLIIGMEGGIVFFCFLQKYVIKLKDDFSVNSASDIWHANILEAKLIS